MHETHDAMRQTTMAALFVAFVCAMGTIAALLLLWAWAGQDIVRQVEAEPPQPPEITVLVVSADDGVSIPTEAWEWHRMEATAYTNGPESTGKTPSHPLYGITRSGLPTRPGVVAVDPDVIPLGSIVYVEGYGLAVALDTGSAIRGYRVDVWFEDLQAALAWGRREVWVGVLTAHDEATAGVEAAAR